LIFVSPVPILEDAVGEYTVEFTL